MIARPLARRAALAVAAGRVRVGDLGVDDEELQARAGEPRSTDSVSSDRQSRNVAASARPSIDAIWSMIPVGAPTASFSARRPTSRAIRGRGRAPTSLRADAVAPSIAADDESPRRRARRTRTTGRRRDGCRVDARRLQERPRDAERVARPLDDLVAAGGEEGVEVRDGHLDGIRSNEDDADAPVGARLSATAVRNSIANGNTKPSL
jgi:hypothetical protein